MRLILFYVAALGCPALNAQALITTDHNSRTAFIRASIPDGYDKNTAELKGFPASPILSEPDEKLTLTDTIQNGTVTWNVLINKPYYVSSSFIGLSINYLLEPGDSVNIYYSKQNRPLFSGKSAAKFELLTSINLLTDSLNHSPDYRKLSRKYHPLYSVGDYFNWNALLNSQLKKELEITEQYKNSISDYAYNKIKEYVINRVEQVRLDRFRALIEAPGASSQLKEGVRINRYGLSNKNICAIYDSTINNLYSGWLLSESPVAGSPHYYYDRLRFAAYREKGRFFRENPSDTSSLGKDKIDNYVYRYYLGKKMYRGEIREAALSYFFHYPKAPLKTMGFHPKMEAILADYYANSQYPDYARAAKNHELMLREKKTGLKDLPFTLTDRNGHEVMKEQLEGKVTLFDFWFTGCAGCVQLTPMLRVIEKRFENNPHIQFINVSIDENKEEWLKSLAQKKYTTASGTSLYTGGKGKDHFLIKNYLISSYPSLLLFDAHGKSIPDHMVTDPRIDSGKSLIALIEKQLVIMKDGPYVFYKNKGMQVDYIIGNKLLSGTLQKNSRDILYVQTDTEKQFPVKLKKKINIEPSVFSRPERLLILSDIEGNFDALRQLLQANKIIDKDYNWIFDDGHLVFLGDMFDRGSQVSECLWLIYSLEEKAQKSGGYVHFILGNHEVMNLYGDNRYTQLKYKKNASLLNYNLSDLHNEKSELGRWLRSKNIIEKVGDLLFVHAGVSQSVNNLSISLEEINKKARPLYATGSADYAEDVVKTIMNDRKGIFWYRGYYSANEEKTLRIVDSTLHKFLVNHIVTGHTVVGDTISVHYGGRIFNVDTRHAQGKSEALMIEGNNFYRVNNKGDRFSIFMRYKGK